MAAGSLRKDLMPLRSCQGVATSPNGNPHQPNNEVIARPFQMDFFPQDAHESCERSFQEVLMM